MLDIERIDNLDLPKTYRGFLKEALIYSASIFIRHNPSNKFLILTTGRTGSNLLVELLNSHPSIYCNSEILVKKVAFPKLLIRRSERLAHKKVYGFKLNTYNFFVQGIKNPLEFVNNLFDRGYKLICLKRRNLLRQAISRMYAYHTKKFHLNKNEGKVSPVTLRVDLNQLQREIKLFEIQIEIENRILENHPYLQLFYEDGLHDECDHQKTIDRIADYLDISSGRVSSNLVRTTPEDLSSLIQNYDEFRQFVLNTKYAKYLDMNT